MSSSLLDIDRAAEAMLEELSSLNSTNKALQAAQGDVSRMVQSVDSVVQSANRLIHTSSEQTETVNQFAQSTRVQLEGAVVQVQNVPTAVDLAIQRQYSVLAAELAESAHSTRTQLEGVAVQVQNVPTAVELAIQRQNSVLAAELAERFTKVHTMLRTEVLPAIDEVRRIDSFNRVLLFLLLTLVAGGMGFVVWLNRAALFSY